MARTPRTDVYQKVTDRIVAALETAQSNNWQQPWASLGISGLPYNITTGKRYRGVNVWLLAGLGYTDPRWATTNQWREFAGWRRNPKWKGRKSSFEGIKKWIWAGEGEEPATIYRDEKPEGHTIVRWVVKNWTEEVTDPVTGKTEKKARKSFTPKMFTVYNAEQVTVAPPLAGLTDENTVDPAVKYTNCQEVLDALDIDIRHGGDRACYNIESDFIRSPEVSQFQDVESYWGTLWHEVTHWTGHESRENRQFGTRFGDEAYAFEELVAELGAAFLCAELGIEGTLQHPEYIASWLKVLKGDKKAIFTASSKAQAAVDFILNGGKKVKRNDESDNDNTNAVQGETALAA